MVIYTDTFIPYEYKDKHDAYKYVAERCHNIKRSLRYIEKDTEHLTVRCPVSGDYLEITGSADELNWLHNELIQKSWYKPI